MISVMVYKNVRQRGVMLDDLHDSTCTFTLTCAAYGGRVQSIQNSERGPYCQVLRKPL